MMIDSRIRKATDLLMDLINEKHGPNDPGSGVGAGIERSPSYRSHFLGQTLSSHLARVVTLVGPSPISSY